MQVLSSARRLARVLKPLVLLRSAANHKLLPYDIQIAFSPPTPHQWQNYNSFSSQSLYFSGTSLLMAQQQINSWAAKASFSTEATSAERTPTEAVKELYDKILESVNVRRTMAPNAWLWSLIENCKNHEDIKLLFDSLQNLRRFRLSNLRIHDNFNCHLCREVTKACARVGAIDFGKMALWKHNVYGLTPNIGSANHLLSYAKEHNNVSFMVEVMKLLKKNNIPLQPSTADIVFSICYNAGNWELISKYSKKFLKAGVKLRKTAFDIWMDFAIKRGDTESLWQIEKLRSELMQQHTLVSAFSCAKGLILEHKLEDAAAVIQVLNQTLPDAKKSGVNVQLQKLVSEWPLDVVKHQPEENKKAVAAALKSDIPAIVGLLNMGLELNVNLEDLTSKEEIPS
ncbi:hypothetical protein P3X46_027787 [Hevea brasiliensis]|uniref:Pentacotripeptide-repeat region of PRORP domain-containing protein n=1 Tax=Hevea brasiliensis TaxID=3981 RepID=A0ABQ9L1Y7_HEVBR|nr:uncharacterized protein LOC110631472 [Hevea brasiliensis]KAJ9154456.1 hypothetical protein P3X46_027787 [Hevea brasiliensis]